jgi:hypothetical protein
MSGPLQLQQLAANTTENLHRTFIHEHVYKCTM